MNVDEMDLVSQLKEAAPLRPEAYERARTTLRAAMTEPAPARAREMALVPGAGRERSEKFSGAGNRRRGMFGTWGKVGIGAGVGAVAAGVAVALAATSTPQPAAPARSASPVSHAPAVNSRLVTLAAAIKAKSGNLPGNASLVIQTGFGATVPKRTYNLYTDSGAYYLGATKKGLAYVVANKLSMRGHKLYARQVVAAARDAATGDLTTARERLLNTGPNQFEHLLRDSPAARRELWAKLWAKPWLGPLWSGNCPGPSCWAGPAKRPATPSDKILQKDIDSTIWYNSVNALTEGAGNPQVREGVLRVLSTLPEITVANSTTGAQPTLTLTASAAISPYVVTPAQVVTISASTGMPISSVWGTPGHKLYTGETFRVSRVWMAQIRAGRW